MQSFRSEIENPFVSEEIIELDRKIRLFRQEKLDEDKFKSLRLARGIYGQRQPGVQMVRIKLPFGRATGDQLLRICDVSDEYSRGRLHITTRQDIQIHYVSLDRTPELWNELDKDDVTIREACGNTVRNVTGSPEAGIDPDEVFDITPYAHATFKYLLRNPMNQEMGRKFKISFSSSDQDTALSYIHDVGLIPRIQNGQKGFKVVIGGGLGSQPRSAEPVHDFLPTDQIIPFIEGVIRVFDRYGERSKRMKARMKFLIKDIGLEAFLDLVEKEKLALAYQSYPISEEGFEFDRSVVDAIKVPKVDLKDIEGYEKWRKSNVFDQKQEGLHSIGIKVRLGDFYTPQARKLANLIKEYAANELRFTLRQDILLRHIKSDLLPLFYLELKELGFTELGFNSTADITACPGTDTCNLGIASSTGIADVLEDVIDQEYPQYKNNRDIYIKISGCMNACGQHNMAHIGFQGMTIRTPDKLVAPALQVLLGGGALGNGEGRFADKVIKIPSKRGPEALRLILNDYDSNKQEGENFMDYYDRKEQLYFYNYLKPLSEVDNLVAEDFVDWGNVEKYEQKIGVGECAGVVIDLVATLLLESEEKIEKAEASLAEGNWAHSIYHSYSSLVNTAKALLISENKKTNTQVGIINQFDELFVATGKISINTTTFPDYVYQINRNKPSEAFAASYLENAKALSEKATAFRKLELANADK